jgi:DHA3 family tetracycline resistance protein-like MFS transporter
MAGSRARILAPLRHRDFRLWTAGAGVSLLGDGIFLVALAWQVYDLWSAPAAFAIVGAVWTLPNVAFLLLGGVVSDRFDRRKVMVAADVVRGVAIGAIGFLSATGSIRLWHVFVGIGFMGVGDAFFNPASTAIVPDLVPEEDLTQANALAGMLRPFMLRFAGPALGGILVGTAGAGWALMADAATFVVSAIAVSRIVARPVHVLEADDRGTTRFRRELGEGWAFVRRSPWCWATLLAALLSLLAFFGPLEVLLPFLVKEVHRWTPETLGLIFGAGGVGAILGALVLGQRGLPKRMVSFMYWSWAIGVLLIAVFGVMTQVWQAVVASFFMQLLFQLGTVVWITLMQRLVPRHLLGRVVSLDWLVSIGLVPLSFLLTAPAVQLFGPRNTLIGGGVLAAVVTAFLLFVPGVRDPERPGTPLGAQMTPSSSSAASSSAVSPSSSR